MPLFYVTFTLLKHTVSSWKVGLQTSGRHIHHIGYFQHGKATKPSWHESPIGERKSSSSSSSSLSSSSSSTNRNDLSDDVPLLLAEGLLAVNKPLNWTSSDVVSYIRRMLENDTRKRGGTVSKISSKGKRKLRVGHGGTLDPLATGVLVIGIGSGTKCLELYLKGSKKYVAQGEFGFETTTLDMEGDITKRAPYDHITMDSIESILPMFRGEIQQIPPVFSALKKDGKKLYQEARKGKSAEDLNIESRTVMIYDLKLIDPEISMLPKFNIEMECGGGTYVRSLIRDIANQLDSVATTTILTRVKQGPFTLKDAIEKEEWTPEKIYESIISVDSLQASQVL
jgi:tRNA pseudouridine55 synthase